MGDEVRERVMGGRVEEDLVASDKLMMYRNCTR